MPFSDLVGHHAVAGHLRGALQDGRLAHAVLLTGSEGVGKTSLAEALAFEALDAGSWPGGLAAHPDHWLEDSDAERIGIDRVRAGGGTPVTGPSLQDFFALRAYAGGRRVAVVGRADRLTEQAANSVLKTLEEPPPLSHVVLCASHAERLPATVVSRCQTFACGPVVSSDLRGWLETAHGVDPALAGVCASLAAGRPGRALQLATAPGALRTEIEAVDAFLAVAGGGRAAALTAAGALAPPNTAEGRERAMGRLAAWTAFVRDVACLSGGAPELAVWPDYREAAEAWALALPPGRVVEILGRCVELAEQLAQYAVPRLAFEVLFLDIFATAPPPPRVLAPRHDPRTAGPGAAAPSDTATTSRGRTTRRRG